MTGPAPEKTPAEMKQEMLQTREAITEKVAALEHQVLGTIQTAADTVTNTVDAVKDAVASAPAAVGETMKQTVEAVKESVAAFSVSECVRSHPWTSMGGAFLAGFLLGRRSGTSPAAPVAPVPIVSAPRESAPREPGLVSEVCGMAGRELRQLAEETIRSFAQTAKQAVQARMPNVVDAAIHHWADASPAREPASRMRRDAVCSNGI